MVRLFICLESSLRFSIRYRRELDISWRNSGRYYKKSVSLAWCYLGFSVRKTLHEARAAGLAGFLCCAYDVVTDWHHFDQKMLERYRGILCDLVPGELQSMVHILLDRELSCELQFDGLERGVTAFAFITKLMGTDSFYDSGSRKHLLGMALQVVDDLLDYQHDVALGEINCLRSERAAQYVSLMKSVLDSDKLPLLFSRSFFLRNAIKKAQKQGQKFLVGGVSTQSQLHNDTPRGPYQSQGLSSSPPYTNHEDYPEKVGKRILNT